MEHGVYPSRSVVWHCCLGDTNGFNYRGSIFSPILFNLFQSLVIALVLCWLNSLLAGVPADLRSSISSQQQPHYGSSVRFVGTIISPL